MTKTIMFTTRKISSLQANVCYSGLCNRKTRKECKKNKECGIDLCGNDMDKIAFRKIIYSNLSDKQFKKRMKKVDEWRIEQIKRCKPVVFIIRKLRS